MIMARQKRAQRMIAHRNIRNKQGAMSGKRNFQRMDLRRR